MDWRNKNVFLKGEKITDMSSPRLSPNEVRNIVYDLQKFTNYGKACIIPEYKVTHSWTKRSIFWDLPYWKDTLLRQNLYVMHIEKNFFDNVFYTPIDVQGKTKHNKKAREDLEKWCN